MNAAYGILRFLFYPNIIGYSVSMARNIERMLWPYV